MYLFHIGVVVRILKVGGNARDETSKPEHFVQQPLHQIIEPVGDILVQGRQEHHVWNLDKQMHNMSHTRTYTYTHRHTQMHTHTHIHIHMHTHIYAHTRKRTRTHTHKHTHTKHTNAKSTHTHAHTRTHSHTHTHIVHPECFRSNVQNAIAVARRNRPRVNRSSEFACVYSRLRAFAFACICEYCSRSSVCAYVRAIAHTWCDRAYVNSI